MPKRAKKPAAKTVVKDKILPRVTIKFFDKPLLTGFIWLSLLVFGFLSYTTLLKREGFPSVNIPLTIVSGTYFVNNAEQVDNQVAKPLSEIAQQNPSVKTVQTQSASNFFTAQIQYKEGTDAKATAAEIEKAVKSSGQLPPNAQLQYNVPYFGATGGDIQQIDVGISFFRNGQPVSTQELAIKAGAAAQYLNQQRIAHVDTVFVKNPYDAVVNPATGQAVVVQRSFDRYGERHDGQTNYYDSILIGVTGQDGADVIKLDESVRQALDKLRQDPQFAGYDARVSASFAPNIEENLGELQRVLIEGLLAILVVGSLVIAVRASFITVISMITVLLITLGFLYAIGYTLNVITLFALILGLALIVDDTIIMVEAIDAARRHSKNRREIVLEATRKISRAMVAATLTAALSFAPLLFVGGILGSFIRAIPITLISALLISLVVALIFIPFLSRFILLGRKQLGKKGVKEVAAGFEARLAAFIAKPMLWARGSRRKLIGVIVSAMLVGLAFIFAGLVIARNVVFNIFPPTKDTNALSVNLQFAPGTTIEQAEAIAEQADKLVGQQLGDNYEYASYYNTGSAQDATMQIVIKPYTERDPTSVDLVNQLQQSFNDFNGAKVTVGQVDVGPPAAPFVVQIDATNRQAAFAMANDMAEFLSTTELKRPNGTTVKLENVGVSSPDQYVRTNGRPIITVSAGFDGTDTTTLVTLAQDAVNKEFPDNRQQSYGLQPNAISFDIGQESENQDSFKTLALAFPVLLLVMYILLGIQFRSLLQPILIFMAIPFSLFGIMLGLDLTNNAISFFAMLGFFALVGLSIKNTILLTDYANQARRAGAAPIDAAVAALEERFRPLFATSMTAVVSLIPLAISSPFWQGLAVVLIGGLLSSTFLVVTVFPYYYLGSEYARLKISTGRFLLWLGVTTLIAIAVGLLVNPALAGLVYPSSVIIVILRNYYAKRLAKP